MSDLADMKLFVQAISQGSLSAAGRVLGVSAAVASKRLTRLEGRLGVRLVQRTSRRLALTDEGAIYFDRCQAILADVADAEALISPDGSVRGLLRVTSSVALGRRWVGPALARFATLHPQLTVHLSLSDELEDLVEGGFDCAVRIGGPADSRLVARPLAANRRVVCAAPAYLAQHGTPRTPGDLPRHACIVMSPSAPHADWTFEREGETERVRVPGRFITDNGEQAHDWALAGFGLVRRSVWDVASDLLDGRLVEVLPEWSGASAPIQALFVSRRFLPARTRLFLTALADTFTQAHVPV